VVCNLNERTQNVFDPASVSTRRRRKIAEKEEENEERPAESSEMDLDTTRSHIRPKQVLYTGRSPWWPINQQDLGSQQHRVVELFSLRARPPFLLFSCFVFFSRRLRAAQLVRHSTEIPPRVCIYSPPGATRFGVCNSHFSANSIPRSFVAAGSSLLPASLLFQVSAKFSVRCGRGRQIPW
jgi:hypothetical protein